MAQKPLILLIGFGYVAWHTVSMLTARGWGVMASSRSREGCEAIAAVGVEPVQADPDRTDGQAALAAAVERATHILSSVPPGQDGDPVLAALPPACLDGKRLIYLSTTGVYGDRAGGWCFERDPIHPGQDRSRRRASAEAQWLARGALSLRLGGIYGPERSPVDRLKAKDGIVYDKPGQVFSRIHVGDIAQAIVRAVDQPGLCGPVNLVDDRPCSQVELMTGTARLAGLPAPVVEPFDRAQLSAMAASFWAENRRVSNALAKAALGWRPAYPTWREGVEALLKP